MKIASIPSLLLVLALGAPCEPVRGAGTNNAPRVGSLREFDRFNFEGATSFSTGNLWLALNSTFDFPVQSHPLAPRDAFLRAIESQLRLGYSHCGFPDARIIASHDARADRVVVRVEEGPRYRCGPVEVIGARKMPVPPIVEALTVTNAGGNILRESFQFLDNAPANRSETAETNTTKIWVAGQPAHFDGITLDYLSGKVTNTLAKHGFFRSRFTLNVVTNPADQTATLQVKILDEGRPAIIDRITVMGIRRNSRKTVLNYLGLKTGMFFTSDLAAAINDRLYQSARFLTNSVQAGPPDASGRVKMVVEVVENAEGPPLNDAFKPVEQAMLKTRDWLVKLSDSGEEAVFSITGNPDDADSAQFILAPRKGLLMLESRMVGGTNRLRRALILSPSQIALYAFDRQQKIFARLSAAQFESYLTIETQPPDADGHCANFTVGAEIQSLGDATNAPPSALSLSLAPAAFLHQTPGEHYVRQFDGDQLVISNAETLLRLDARTGRIIEMAFNRQESHHPHLALHFEPDAFGPALAGAERDGAGFANLYHTNSPFGSTVAFFSSELVQLPTVDAWLRARLPAITCEQLPALLRRLGAEDFLQPWENFVDKQSEPDDPGGTFEIPEAPRPVMGGSFGAGVAVAAGFILKGGDLIFPPRSWPWTVSRDIALLYRCHQDFLQADLTDIYHSEDAGPIGCLVTAWALQGHDSSLSKAAAARGLQRLSAEAFRSDCRLFLDEHYVSGQFAARLAATLADLNEPELDGVTAVMPAKGAGFVRDCAQRVRAAQKGQPLFETIAPVLDACWEKELEQDVANRLKRYASQ